MTFPFLTLAAGDTTLQLVPQLGAKVVSLRHGDHEWLAAPARALGPFREPPGPWADYDCSGWDECFPNIGAEPTLRLADHGVAWSAGWQVIDKGPTFVTTRLNTATARFERRLEVAADGGAVTAAYRVVATGKSPLRWAWAQHPMLAADTATRIQLPHDARVRVDSALRQGINDADVAWLAPNGVLAADTLLSEADGRAAKLWLAEPLPAWVRVTRHGRALTWRLDASTAPHAGLWVNLGGWEAGTPARLGHVAVEPAFGSYDAFAAAEGAGAGPVLAPGEAHAWEVRIDLSHSE